MSTNQKYINISNNFISGYNNGTEARITIASESTGKSIISLNHSTTNLGFEFLPNPVNNGIFRYRYSPTSTTTILGFDGPTMYMNITNLKTNIGSFINSNNKRDSEGKEIRCHTEKCSPSDMHMKFTSFLLS
jgi:hypothetical protein